MSSEVISSIGIYLSDLPTVKTWAQSYNLSMPDFLRVLILAVKEHKQREMYTKLPMPSDYKKPLASKRIDKNRLNNKFAQLTNNRCVAKQI
jgi:hypothetical protein